jgi:hypothetical protein
MATWEELYHKLWEHADSRREGFQELAEACMRSMPDYQLEDLVRVLVGEEEPS